MIAVFVLCLGLVGCGGGAESSSSASESSSAASSSASSSEASSSSGAEASSSSSGESASSGSSSEAASSQSSESILDEEALAAADNEEYKATFAGTWAMVAMSDGTEVLKVESLDESVRSQVESKLTFGEDGRISWLTAGKEITGTWAPTGATTVILYLDPIEGFDEVPPYTGTLDGETLAIDEEGLVMLLERE